MNSLKNEHQYKQADGEIIHMEKKYILCTYKWCDLCHRERALQRMESQRLIQLLILILFFKKK